MLHEGVLDNRKLKQSFNQTLKPLAEDEIARRTRR